MTRMTHFRPRPQRRLPSTTTDVQYFVALQEIGVLKDEVQYRGQELIQVMFLRYPCRAGVAGPSPPPVLNIAVGRVTMLLRMGKGSTALGIAEAFTKCS